MWRIGPIYRRPILRPRKTLTSRKKTLPNPSRFRFEKVNEATWKLTNGEMANVPTRFGFWSGYRITKAIAWVICLVPGQWLARCGDRACGPSRLNRRRPMRSPWQRAVAATTKS